ncbi:MULTISPECIES: TetR/AcrR family transcriptional regulator [unclassified Microbacterium]|uniref:TetR/AcrR family transcriptional regulator n=1 Tax=unclassified Microbacterium TaxID=2609290 RepID=UPI000EA867B9|nr:MULTISPECIES: TetR/AcrR family transcriptional regulator [unclassified Microbacterium]MBT2484361.1 TetR/AcrR family transcriptional regulator [Microbacterium sp. ISL-108]RKN67274.1 TetR/AcrR family transcriptional regulator [Microbacterium sp. CGR2]
MTRATILAEARTIFARQGYAETSLREIAEAVGIKTPSLYAHFSSKEALYEAVYAEVAVEHTAFFDELARRSGELEPLARLRHLLGGIEDYYRDRPDLAEFSLRAAVAEYGPGGQNLREIFLDSESTLAAAVRKTYDDGAASGTFAAGDADGFIALVFVIMDGLFLQLTHYTPEVYRERFEHTWQHLATILSR